MHFITYKKPPGIYTIKETLETVYSMGDHEGTLGIENDDTSMKATNYWLDLVVLSECWVLMKNRFSLSLLGLIIHWDYKPVNAGSPGMNI